MAIVREFRKPSFNQIVELPASTFHQRDHTIEPSTKTAIAENPLGVGLPFTETFIFGLSYDREERPAQIGQDAVEAVARPQNIALFHQLDKLVTFTVFCMKNTTDEDHISLLNAPLTDRIKD